MALSTRHFVSDLVAQVGSLPSLAAQVVALAGDPNCDFMKLCDLIRADNVLSLRFLALANASSFAGGQEVRDLRGALVRLGTRRVRNVALLMGLHDMHPAAENNEHFDNSAFWLHSLAVAGCAQALARRGEKVAPDDAWLVGILHGLGVTTLHQQQPEDFGSVVRHARGKCQPLVTSEIELLEFHHGEVAGRLLGNWNLPRAFVDAVELHVEDADQEMPAASVDLVDILRDAIALARAAGCGHSGDGDAPPTLDEMSQRLDLGDAELVQLAADVDRDVTQTAELVGLQHPVDAFTGALAASRREVARVGLAGLDATLAHEELQAQLEAARDIQRRILPPEIPTWPGYELAAANIPSRSVSGDTYDFGGLADGTFLLSVADVSGKGVPAALLASTLQATLRALAPRCSDPGALLEAANAALFASTDAESFATVFLVALCPDRDELVYAAAGHEPALLVKADGTLTWLRPGGPGLGMLPEADFPTARIPFGAGDLLVVTTDGVTDAEGPDGQAWGRKGLAACVADAGPAAGPANVVSTVRKALVVSGETGPADDLTLVVVRRT